MENYPFVKCLQPRKVINPWTKEVLVVPCGKCAACCNYKSMRSTFQLKLESLSHKYCLFVTLTFDESNIPLCSFVNTESSCIYQFYDVSTGEFISESFCSADELTKLQYKCSRKGCFPYLSKTELQLFIKRVRKKVDSVSHEKIRYYAVGEYGPLHLRPHYHILFFFSSDTTLSAIVDNLSSLWRFGRTDAQIAKGDCSSYVASYVNSFGALPSLFRDKAFSPFVLHSQFLGQKVLQLSKEKAYSVAPREFISRSIAFDGVAKEFNLWRSCYFTFFPKCRGFSSLSSRGRIESYRIYLYAKELFPQSKSVLDLARYVAGYCSICQTTRDILPFLDRKVVDYFLCSRSVPDAEGVGFQRFVSSVYYELLLSYHFLFFCCDNTSGVEIKRKVHMIEDFYSALELNRLSSWYTDMSLYFLDDLHDSDDIVYFYDNVFHESMSMLPIYSQFVIEQNFLSERLVKHKKLNDANRILFNS